MRPHATPFAITALVALLAAPRTLCAAHVVELALVDREQGQVLPEVRHGGEAWVAGEPGHRYAVRLANRSGERVLVVLSVDGINAVTGERASPAQAGYVLSPWETAEIPGWRKSLDEVAQFRFTGLPDSYAARTGRPDDIGVIGIAVFEEHRPRRPPGPPIARGRHRHAGADTQGDAGVPGATGAAAYRGDAEVQHLGTGHGARERAPTVHTRFVRASSRPVQLTQVRYDDGDALVARGILPRRTRAEGRAPRAFAGGFVPDPPAQ